MKIGIIGMGRMGANIARRLMLAKHETEVWDRAQEAIDALGGFAARGDISIDGGNTFYKDDIRRAKALAEKGIRYVDVGTSGGVWGLERGFCMMVGGDKDAVDHIAPFFA